MYRIAMMKTRCQTMASMREARVPEGETDKVFEEKGGAGLLPLPLCRRAFLITARR
jgi:hypothetical protein